MILLAALLLMPAPSGVEPDDVARFGCVPGRPVDLKNSEEVQAAYARRSVVIVRAGLAREAVRLRTMVAPTATFAIFDGDEGTGPRSTGAEAMVEFARQLNPDDFQFDLAAVGPIGVDPCAEVAVEIRLGGTGPDEASKIVFSYRGGMLTGASGRHVTLVRGEFRSTDTR